MTTVQKVHLLNGWARVLVDIPFRYVDRAFLDYLSDASAVDDQGRAIRPAPARIKTIAYDFYNSDRLRETIMARPAALPSRSHVRDEDYVPTVSHELMKVWWQAWLECGFSTAGEQFESYKLRIRTRANQINPECGWQLPGELSHVW